MQPRYVIFGGAPRFDTAHRARRRAISPDDQQGVNEASAGISGSPKIPGAVGCREISLRSCRATGRYRIHFGNRYNPVAGHTHSHAYIHTHTHIRGGGDGGEPPRKMHSAKWLEARRNAAEDIKAIRGDPINAVARVIERSAARSLRCLWKYRPAYFGWKRGFGRLHRLSQIETPAPGGALRVDFLARRALTASCRWKLRTRRAHGCADIDFDLYPRAGGVRLSQSPAFHLSNVCRARRNRVVFNIHGDLAWRLSMAENAPNATCRLILTNISPQSCQLNRIERKKDFLTRALENHSRLSGTKPCLRMNKVF